MAEWNRDETQWRQGLLLASDAVEALGLDHSEFSERTLVIVASHDCDLAQSPEKEPHIEVVIGRLAPEKDGNSTPVSCILSSREPILSGRSSKQQQR